MNLLVQRAKNIISRIEFLSQTINDAAPEKKNESGDPYSDGIMVYLMMIMGEIMSSDGHVNAIESEFIYAIKPQSFSNDYVFLLKKLNENYADLSSRKEIPVFLKLAILHDMVFKTEFTDEIVQLAEKFGCIVIALDGVKGELEINKLVVVIEDMRNSLEYYRESMRGEIEPKQSEHSPVKIEASEKQLDDLLNELRAMIGLHRAKEEVTAATNLVRVRQMRQEAGLPAMPMTLHMVFTGNPGTGKTTVARLIAQIYRELGLLDKGHLTEVDRSGLVGGYVGQTALKVQEVVQQARGGVLFIDEAYALKDGHQDSYGQEAINTLLKSMEDHRDDLVVIVAGYTEQMNVFLETNPGLRSRFNRYVHFDDYTGDELLNIFTYMSEKNGYASTPMATYQLKSHFEQMYDQRGRNFGNARDVRNVFETILKHQAARLMTIHKPTPEDLSFIDLADIAWLFERSSAGAAQKGRA